MDLFLVFVLGIVVAVAGMGWLRNNGRKPVEDEWVLPPETPAGQRPAMGTYQQPGATQVFDRDAIERGRQRTFDPRGWDDRADIVDAETVSPASPDSPPEDLPRYFDRDYLERRDRGTGEPPRA